jgi:hypothetical protein
MTEDVHTAVLTKLESIREELQHQVGEVLFAQIPVVGISDKDTAPVKHHHHNMSLTAERFHDIVMAGAGIDTQLVTAEFGWADRKLGTMGITHEHHQAMIDAYFSEALKLHTWTDEERAALESIKDTIRKAATEGYTDE